MVDASSDDPSLLTSALKLVLDSHYNQAPSYIAAMSPASRPAMEAISDAASESDGRLGMGNQMRLFFSMA